MNEPAVNRREFLRGGFLRGLFGGATAAPAPISKAIGILERIDTQDQRPPIPVLRPPGSIPEAAFLKDCTRCNDCITACPHGAIVLAPARLRAAAGTPMIDPGNQACMACPDTPCITACAPRALRREPEAPFPIMGTARVQVLDCFAHQGTTCVSCVERCPVPGAIDLITGKPTINPALCVGCGVCANVCPAPRPAILITPKSLST